MYSAIASALDCINVTFNSSASSESCNLKKVVKLICINVFQPLDLSLKSSSFLWLLQFLNTLLILDSLVSIVGTMQLQGFHHYYYLENAKARVSQQYIKKGWIHETQPLRREQALYHYYKVDGHITKSTKMSLSPQVNDPTIVDEFITKSTKWATSLQSPPSGQVC